MAAGGIYIKALEGTGPVLLYVFLAPFLLMGLALFFFGIRGLIRLAQYGGWTLRCPDEGRDDRRAPQHPAGSPPRGDAYRSDPVPAQLRGTCRLQSTRSSPDGRGRSPDGTGGGSEHHAVAGGMVARDGRDRAGDRAGISTSSYGPP